MAAPHVAGVAALVAGAIPGMSPGEIATLIRTTGECPNGASADADGSGTCEGKGQWTNDPDGIAEPLVSALNAMGGTTPPAPTPPGAPAAVTASSAVGQVPLT